MTPYEIEVSGQEASGVPNLRATFGRVNVIVGTNGSGKSRLIEFLRGNRSGNFGGPRPHVFFEGARSVVLPDNLHLDSNTVGRFGSLQQAQAQHASKVGSKVVQRVRDALFVLERRSEEEKTAHSDAVHKWQQQGEKGPCPSRPEAPLDRLFRLFNEIFPTLTLAFERPNLRVKKRSSHFGLSNLSDGEKQALIILADIGILAPDNAVIFVDEPELNLHPSLAEQLWAAIESDRPDGIFVYATHSVSFAMRQGVDRIIALSNAGSPIAVADIASLPSSELRPFLGSVPALLRSSRALLVEGDESSFDVPFYRWILNDPTIDVVAVGDCHQVVGALRRAGIWSNLATSLALAGVVDRDFRSDDRLAVLSSDLCHVLEMHEAESYLCSPDLVVAIGRKLGLVEGLTLERVTSEILMFARAQIGRTAMARTIERTTIRLAVSARRQAFREGDLAASVDALRRAAEEEAAKIHGAIDPDTVERLLRQETARCEGVVDARDTVGVLRIFPGKELLPRLAQLVGARDALHLARAVKKQVSPDEFEHTRTLKENLRALNPAR